MSASRYWTVTMFELPGVGEDGMSGRNEQRKLGTTRGSPRRSRTAKASRISRRAVKSRCACEWGGWGRLSVDGPGQHNPTSSEDPWGRWSIHRMAVQYIASTDPTLGGSTLKHEGRRQTGRRSVYAGSRLNLTYASLRANDGETSESLKFSLEGVGQPSHGHAKQRIENEWSRWS
jgi:hypothetical protein